MIIFVQQENEYTLPNFRSANQSADSGTASPTNHRYSRSINSDIL